MNKNVKTAAVTGIVTILALLVAWTVFSPYLVLDRMRNAIATGNGPALNRYIDYASLRASVKEQIGADLAAKAVEKRRSPVEAAMALAVVGPMIDTILQPEMIVAVLADRRSTRNPMGGKFFGEQVHVRRSGIGRFVVEGGTPGGVVFEMRGLGWKLVGVERASAATDQR